MKSDKTKEESYIKDISWCGESYGSNASVVDVKDGKIVRIRPLHYDWKYDPEEFNPWKIEARGQTFEQTSLGARTRVRPRVAAMYSSHARVLPYPGGTSHAL